MADDDKAEIQRKLDFMAGQIDGLLMAVALLARHSGPTRFQADLLQDIEDNKSALLQMGTPRFLGMHDVLEKLYPLQRPQPHAPEPGDATR